MLEPLASLAGLVNENAGALDPVTALNKPVPPGVEDPTGDCDPNRPVPPGVEDADRGLPNKLPNGLVAELEAGCDPKSPVVVGSAFAASGFEVFVASVDDAPKMMGLS